MRVAFFGNGFEYSLHFLRVLTRHPEVELVALVAPVKGRQRRKWRRLAEGAARLVRAVDPGDDDDRAFPIQAAQLARRAGAAQFWPDTVNDAEVMAQVAACRPEVVVMAGFNQILKPVVLEAMPPILNIHPSLLPLYRGPHPEFWTIAHGERRSGVTVHFVDEGVDTGPVAAQAEFEVEPWLTAAELQRRSMRVGGELLEELMQAPGPQYLPRLPQEGEGSYHARVQAEDLLVPFDRPSAVVYDRARAAAPWASLLLYVPAEWWLSAPGPDDQIQGTHDPAPGLLCLALSSPSRFPDHRGLRPGMVQRTESGGIAVGCSPGTVHFAEVKA